MKIKNEQLLEDICKKMGFANGSSQKILSNNRFVLSGKDGIFYLFGFLLRKETLFSWFGEAQVCRACGSMDFVMEQCECLGEDYCGHPDYPIECNGCNIDYDSTTSTIPAWEYHGRELIGLDTEEIFDYYRAKKINQT